MLIIPDLPLFPSHLSLFLLGQVTFLVNRDELVSFLDHRHVLSSLHLIEFELVAEVGETFVVEVEDVGEAAVEHVAEVGGAGDKVLEEFETLVLEEGQLSFHFMEGVF